MNPAEPVMTHYDDSVEFSELDTPDSAECTYIRQQSSAQIKHGSPPLHLSPSDTTRTTPQIYTLPASERERLWIRVLLLSLSGLSGSNKRLAELPFLGSFILEYTILRNALGHPFA